MVIKEKQIKTFVRHLKMLLWNKMINQYIYIQILNQFIHYEG